MQPFRLFARVFIIVAFAAPAFAGDNPASPEATPVPGVTAPATSPAIAPGSPAAPAAVSPPEEIKKPAEIKPVKATLKDGTPIEFEPDGSVMILNADGGRTPAPDGVLTLKDGTTFAVKGGSKTED